MHITDNHDALLDYLYEEGDPGQRLKISQHLQECAACSVAVLDFQSVRGMLRDWKAPAADLGFRIVQDSPVPAPASVPVAVRRAGAWGWGLQAAAAVLLFVAGMAVSQLNVRYADGALTVSTPQAARAGIVRATAPATPAAAAPEIDYDRLVEKLRASLASPNASGGGPAAVAADASTERLLQRVRAMIDQSEQRQQRELALRLSQVTGEVEAQHQADLMRLQQSVGQTQDVMDYLVRTSGGVK